MVSHDVPGVGFDSGGAANEEKPMIPMCWDQRGGNWLRWRRNGGKSSEGAELDEGGSKSSKTDVIVPGQCQTLTTRDNSKLM